jgi:hypothetical protein
MKTGRSPDKNAIEFGSLNLHHPNYALRGPITQSIFAVHENMPKFSGSFEEVDAVVAYIDSLAEGK